MVREKIFEAALGISSPWLIAGSRRPTKCAGPRVGIVSVLLSDLGKLTAALDGLPAHMTTTRTARAWHYREQLRDILATQASEHRAAAAQSLAQQSTALQDRAHVRRPPS